MNELCPRNCEYLSVTEDKQDLIKAITGEQPPHICNKYNKKLYHMQAHPDLYKCGECYHSIDYFDVTLVIE